MDNFLKNLEIFKIMVEKTPRCLNELSLIDFQVEIPIARWNLSWITRALGCSCGSKLCYLLIASQNIRKKYSASGAAYLECIECKKKTLLFDPEIHGWNGEKGIGGEFIREKKLLKFSKNPGITLVIYQYPGIKEYQELIDYDCKNPEDYFTWFSIYFYDYKLKEIKPVGSYDCI